MLSQEGEGHLPENNGCHVLARVPGQGLEGAWAVRVGPRILFPMQKQIILLDLRSFITLLLKRKVDLF